MTGSGTVRRGGRAVAVLTAAMLVQGCANGLPIFGQSARTEQVVVPEPEPTVSSEQLNAKAQAKPASTTKTKAAVKPQTRSTSLETDTAHDLDLNVTYFVRLMVPVGSELTVATKGDGNSTSKTVKTSGGPPYAVSLPVPESKAGYPMKVTATLTSTIGHVLEGEVTLPKEPGGEVEIVMVPKTSS